MGWIKIHRELADWEWHDDPAMMSCWIHLLINANYEDKQWRGIEVPKGSFVTTINYLSEEIGISVQKVRTCLHRLETNKQISIKSTNKYSIITICKYEVYQDEQDEFNNQITNKQQTNNKQTEKERESNKEIEKDIQEEKENKTIVLQKKVADAIENREKAFADKVMTQFTATYPKQLLEDFIRYWTESNENGRLMRFEKEKVFDIKRRLITWNRNNTNKYQRSYIPKFPGCPSNEQVKEKILTIDEYLKNVH